MSEQYFNLKHKLEELGYNYTLPIEAVSLVDSILADLLQTTKSLQHYMDLSQNAIEEKNSVVSELEPYKKDNTKLLQANNQLHKEIMLSREENEKLSRELKRKVKSMTEEIVKHEQTISKLQHYIRDLSLRNLCAGTQSSRSKYKRKEIDENTKLCDCRNKINDEKDLIELFKSQQELEEKYREVCDEVELLKKQVENRDEEIVRLNMLVSIGRPPIRKKDTASTNVDKRLQDMIKQISELETANEYLKTELESGLQKQHEAMLRALDLADKNKIIQEELQKVDSLALKVEEDCNKRLADMANEIEILQNKNNTLEKELNDKIYNVNVTEGVIDSTIKEKELLQKEVNELVSLNKSLQDKVLLLSESNQDYYTNNIQIEKNNSKYATKDDLQSLLESERRMYEKHLTKIQNQLTETLSLFNNHILKFKKPPHPKQIFSPNPNTALFKELRNRLCESEQKILMLKKENDELRMRKMKDSILFENNQLSSYSLYDDHTVKSKQLPKRDKSPNLNIANTSDLQNRLCESEQKILMLKKENNDLKSREIEQDSNSNANYKDIIKQLNTENTELTKENIELSQQISYYKNLCSEKEFDRGDFVRKDIKSLKDELEKLTSEIKFLKKDKQEYNERYKDATVQLEKLKYDLIMKQKEVEILQDENNSYKMTHRTGKASTDCLKEECKFLKEQIKLMQNSIIKEKTMASQIKQIQIETERSSNEMHNEILQLQKQLTFANNSVEKLEKQCSELNAEIKRLKKEKDKLIDNIKSLDYERDKIVIELDSKTEVVNAFDKKLHSQNYELSRLEKENNELKRKINSYKSLEHKMDEYETQVIFLNGEVTRMQQLYDNALIENKRLQNNLADVNGSQRISRIEYEKSVHEVEALKQQLQHYVDEIRRIEDLLSQKEAERSDMLEHFASLSVEANILENTNQSLESESASKSMQLQSYVVKIQHLESQLIDKQHEIDSQSTRIDSLTCKISTLESEVKLIIEEKRVLEQNIKRLKKMCSDLQEGQKAMCSVDSEIHLYENKIKNLTSNKCKLESEKLELLDKLGTTEKLLSNARKEVIELKLALQDATSETKLLHERISRLSTIESEDERGSSMLKDSGRPNMVEELQMSNDEDDSPRYIEFRKRISKFTHGSTL